MGMFGKIKEKLADPLRGLQPHPLQQGTQIAVTWVDPGLVEYAQANLPREPKIGHRYPVGITVDGNRIVIAAQGREVATFHPGAVGYYIDDLRRLKSAGYYGTTDLLVRFVGSKRDHALALNYGSGAAFGGGIL